MTTARALTVAGATLTWCAAATLGQTPAEWNRKITGLAMTASAAGPPGTCDVTVEWQFEARAPGATFGDLTTEVVLHVNGAELSALPQSAADIGAAGGGGDPALCPVAACSGGCGTVILGSVPVTMACSERAAVCRCQSPPITSVFPSVPFTPDDEIMVLLRPVPGALPDPEPADDTAMIVFGSWNRRMTPLGLELTAGGTTGTYDVHANWTVDLTAASALDQRIGVELDLLINGVLQTTNATDDCLLWDVDSGICGTAPDGTACGTAVVTGASATPTCAAGKCSVPPLTSTFPGVPLQPGDEIMVLLRPAPGALPAPDATDDMATLVFGSWNRRVRSIGLEPTVGGGPDTYDVSAQWALDFSDASTMPAELGAEIELRINGVPQAMTTSEDCVIWDIMDSGGGGGANCAASGATCGDLVIGGLPTPATIDGPFDKCSAPPLAAVFPGVALQPGDELMILLRPSPGALPDADDSDDVGILEFGSWNRKLLAVDVVPSPGGPAGTYDVAADFVVELSGTTNVLLPLGVATEPHAADPCCEEACCCPPCLCSEGGCGGGSSTGSWDTEMVALSLSGVGCGATCDDAGCAEGCNGLSPVAMSCDTEDCVCRSPVITLEWLGIPLDPDDDLTVKLLPIPGALPELPGFPDDDEQTVPVPGTPCTATVHCADLDANAVRDDNCVWWECDSTGTCNGIGLMTFADMGGPFGACPPDQFANIHDRNHALACFAGSSGCDPINIDAGGPFGACPPDGFCNIHDANHALAAFAGTTTCTCQATGPVPESAPVVRGAARLSFEPRARAGRPGDAITVDVYVEGEVEALRSYQLDVQVSGGRSGDLRLVDIRIDNRRDALFANEGGSFAAFNPSTSQMLSGLDDDRGVTVDDRAYLATFVYKVSRRASGAFVIDALIDDGGQTVLVAPENGEIEIKHSQPAVVTIGRFTQRVQEGEQRRR